RRTHRPAARRPCKSRPGFFFRCRPCRPPRHRGPALLSPRCGWRRRDRQATSSTEVWLTPPDLLTQGKMRRFSLTRQTVCLTVAKSQTGRLTFTASGPRETMARTPPDVTDAELAVLQVLWDRGPATIRELTPLLYPDVTDASYATVQKLLERLEAKG